MKHNYIGAMHIHSKYSDGTKDIDYIISQAKKAGLKWIIITEHNNLDAKKHEGFYGDLCVVVGTENPDRTRDRQRILLSNRFPFRCLFIIYSSISLQIIRPSYWSLSAVLFAAFVTW